MRSPGHHRLWVHGIHHGDISLNNLMYNPSPTGKPEGVLNDYDLASWVKFPTTNSDRTGTLPFMALNMLSGGLEDRIPRLYRHDAESFIWVLAYITVINVEYRGCSVKISRPHIIDPWFAVDRESHISSKYAFPAGYGGRLSVTEPHMRYSDTVRSLVDYWVRLDSASQRLKFTGPTKTETDDPRGALEKLVKDVGATLGADAEGEFAKVKALLLETIRAPEVV